MKRTVATLVVSCDKYQLIWPAFFHFYFKNWGHLQYKLYLGTNYCSYDDERVTTITIGQDKGYSAGVKEMLKQIDEEIVIILLDDFLIKNKLDKGVFEKCLDEFEAKHAVYLKLIDTYPMARSASNNLTAELKKNVRYMLGIRIGLYHTLLRI